MANNQNSQDKDRVVADITGENPRNRGGSGNQGAGTGTSGGSGNLGSTSTGSDKSGVANPTPANQEEIARQRRERLARAGREHRLNLRQSMLYNRTDERGQLALAKLLAPFVYLDENEVNFPSSVEWYLGYTDLFYVGTNGETNISTQVTPQNLMGNYPADGSTKNTATDSKFELRLKQLPGRIGKTFPYGVVLDTECYAHVRPVYTPAGVDPNLVDIQYWFFYPYNEPLFEHTTANEPWYKKFTNAIDTVIAGFAPSLADAHEADWEWVTVRFDHRINQITEVFFAKHGLPNQWTSRIKRDGHHPVVFSGKGSHASFPGTGYHPDDALARMVEEAFRKTHDLIPKFIFDKVAKVAKNFILDETDYGPKWDTSKNLVLLKDDPNDDTEHPWARFAGKWGKAGPTSPGSKPSWRHEDLPTLLAEKCWSEPVLDGDYLYYQGGAKGSEVLCRIRKDGKGQEQMIDDRCGSSPFVYGDYVYFQGGTNRDQLWRRVKDGSRPAEYLDGYCGHSPFVEGDYVYYAGGGDRNDLCRIRINGNGGSQKLDNNCFSRPFVDGDYVYFQGSGDRDGLYRRRKDGAGDAQKLDPHGHDCPFVYDDYVYYHGKEHKLYRVKKDGSGNVELLQSNCHFGPMVYYNYIYFAGGGDDPNLYYLPLDESKSAQQIAPNCVSTPVVDRGNVYYRGIDKDENPNYGLYWVLDLSVFM